MNNKKFVIEEMPDLSINTKDNPYATKFRDEMLKYFSNNIILENGQMIYIELSKDLRQIINGYIMDIFINILRSENLIIDNKKIIEEYIKTSKNNSSSFIKNCYEIITSMDQANKMIWNICKKLNDNVNSYNSYLIWQEGKFNIDKKIYDDWDIIYKVRNEIEHPSGLLSPTFLCKLPNGKIGLPIIKWDKKKYDLQNIAEHSIKIISIFARLVIASSFLYSKYTLAVTDKTRTILYKVEWWF